ncbi:SIMPL domain-containing protein [Haladaptatus sp. NG-SE-30]
MRQKRIVAPLVVAVLLATAGCLGGVAGLGEDSSTGAEPTDGSNTAGANSKISVSATGEVTAEPNLAILIVGVEATAANPATARKQVAENVSTMREALANVGLDDDQVTTRHYTIREDYESKRDEATVTRYRAIHTFEIEVENVDQVGTVIETTTDNGATNVGRVQFSLSEETRSELREQALTNAMNNARSDAELLATGANLTIVDVASVATHTGYVQPYRAEASVAASSDGTGIESGPVTVTAQVQVTYNATS